MTNSAIVDGLARASAAMGDLLDRIAADQWTAPTPCTEWSVRDVVDHLVGMNLVFVAMFEESPMPERGADQLRWRIADLLTHAWDLAQATGIPAELPDDLVEQSITFVRTQLPGQSRAGRFADPQPIRDDAPAIDRLAAFTGRPVPWTP